MCIRDSDTRVRIPPIPFQLSLQLVIPGRVFASVLSTRSITKPVGGFDFFVGGLTSGRNRLLSCSLFECIINVLIGIRLLAAEVVPCLIPIALESGLHALPTRFMLRIPPFRIVTLLHNLCSVSYTHLTLPT